MARGQYQLSIPGAQQSMAFIKEVHGDNSVELVPAYLLLAEANLGLRRPRPIAQLRRRRPFLAPRPSAGASRTMEPLPCSSSPVTNVAAVTARCAREKPLPTT